jgi:hypothetical protein
MGFVGAEVRHSAHEATLVDAYVFGSSGMVMIARRHTWTQFSVDYGLMVALADTGLVKGPIINLGWRF